MADRASTDQEVREQAIKSLKRKKVFKTSFATYVIVNAFLVAIWAVSGAGTFWPGFVLAAWGVGLAFQAYGAYGRPPKTITEDDIAKEAQRLKGT